MFSIQWVINNYTTGWLRGFTQRDMIHLHTFATFFSIEPFTTIVMTGLNMIVGTRPTDEYQI